MTIGETRRKTKKAESAEIELLTADYLMNGGQIQELENQESKFQPTWKAYADSAFEDRNDD